MVSTFLSGSPRVQKQKEQMKSEKQPKIPKQEQRKVKVFLIRHGYSIANRSTTLKESDVSNISGGAIKTVLKAFSMVEKAKGLIEKTYEPDPSLTRTGMEQSKNASTLEVIQKIKPHHVFTSVLCRAQQTALFMFPTSKKVIVAPYLKEKNNPVDPFLLNSDNKPFKDIFTQYEKRHNILSKDELGRLTYSSHVLATATIQNESQQSSSQSQQFQVIQQGVRCEYNETAREENGNIQTFLTNYLYHFLKDTNERVTHIAIVCHGGIIRDFVKERQMNNNAVFQVSFHDVSDLKDGRYSSIQKIFDGYTEFKVSCDPQYIQLGENRLLQLMYPYQQVLSKRNYTLHQLEEIYVSENLKYHPKQEGGGVKRFGAQQVRIKKLIQTIKSPLQDNASVSLKWFKHKHPNIEKKSEQQIQKYLDDHPVEKDILIHDTKGMFAKAIRNIKQSHHLPTDRQTVNLINEQVTPNMSSKQIFQLIERLPNRAPF